jgi:hypothetical protein
VAVVLAAGMFGRPFARCMKLRHEIKDALASATLVRVVEHSNEFDDLGNPNKGDFHEKTYATVILNLTQIAELRAAFRVSVDFGETTSSACDFQDHHRIEALQPDGQTFTLDLCFHCQQLRITNQEVRDFPLRWNKSLQKFIISLGMRPDGPWNNR